jgi:hypothetical protein
LVSFALSKRGDEATSAPSSHLKKDDLGLKELRDSGVRVWKDDLGRKEVEGKSMKSVRMD